MAVLHFDALEACLGAFQQIAVDAPVSASADESCIVLAGLDWAWRSCCGEAKATAEVFDRAGRLA